jgi:CRP-like cAMP-binding protein
MIAIFVGASTFRTSPVTDLRKSTTERRDCALPPLATESAVPFSTNSPNHFLLSLSPSDRDLIFPHLKKVTVPHETVIFKTDDTIGRVYFPHSGIISLIVGVSTGQFVEAGMLGRNGVIGAGAALDGQIALNTAIGQADGAGTMIEASVLKRAAQESETLRVALVRQEHALAAQTQQVAVCNALHELEERLSRWLLQSRDLLNSDTLPLTQEFLSQMLGVQRSSVTIVARKLQGAGLISYRRGRIHVLDVEGLQDSCCECYGAINGHFRKLIGWGPDVKASDPMMHKTDSPPL